MVYTTFYISMSTTLPSFNRTTSIVPPYRTNIPSHQHTAPPYRTTAPPYRTTVPYHISSYQHTAPPYRTTVPYHHIIVPTHCTTVPYHLTTVPYHRTVPYIIVPTHRTYLTLPIQPESRLHLLWQFIIYTLFMQDRIERSIGKMWEQKVSNHPSTLPEAALYLRLPDASRLWTWYITWGAWRIHEDSTSSTALRRFTKEAMSSMDAICINIDSGWQRQNLRSGPEALLLSRFININQAVKSSMLSQSKAQQQYANHLRKYLQDLTSTYLLKLSVHQTWRNFVALKLARAIVWPVLISRKCTAKETTVARTFLRSKFWRQGTRIPL